MCSESIECAGECALLLHILLGEQHGYLLLVRLELVEQPDEELLHLRHRRRHLGVDAQTLLRGVHAAWWRWVRSRGAGEARAARSERGGLRTVVRHHGIGAIELRGALKVLRDGLELRGRHERRRRVGGRGRAGHGCVRHARRRADDY